MPPTSSTENIILYANHSTSLFKQVCLTIPLESSFHYLKIQNIHCHQISFHLFSTSKSDEFTVTTKHSSVNLNWRWLISFDQQLLLFLSNQI
eukprot:Gb_34143 [translate_table: standard]